MNHIRGIVCLMCMLAMASLAMANVITQWNEIAALSSQQNQEVSIPASRSLAMVHVAVFDSVNAIYHKYQPYKVSVDVNSNTCPEAAAVSAAYHVLYGLYPAERTSLAREYQASLGAIPDGSAKERGIWLGEYVAKKILAWRAADGANRTIVDWGGTAPGQWRPTPPDYSSALFVPWVKMPPFAMGSTASFIPGPPPALSSSAYARDVNEVKALGSRNSTIRTAKQTEIGLFWGEAPGTEASVSTWNDFARDVVLQKHLSLVDSARVFALLNLAMADTIICAWQCKFKYDLWRPVTAIREAGRDYNPATSPDANWLPLLQTTPAFPEYVSGHASFSAAGATVLKGIFGNYQHFDGYSHNQPWIKHSYTSFTQAADETALGRLYGGVHYRFALVNGRNMGIKIGNYMLTNMLRPVQ